MQVVNKYMEKLFNLASNWKKSIRTNKQSLEMAYSMVWSQAASSLDG